MDPNNAPADVRDETYAAAAPALMKAGGRMADYMHTRVSPDSLIPRT